VGAAACGQRCRAHRGQHRFAAAAVRHGRVADDNSLGRSCTRWRACATPPRPCPAATSRCSRRRTSR
jgi:hypothetical protein